MIRKLFLICIILLPAYTAQGQSEQNIDSVMSKMTRTDMIRQLLLVEGDGDLEDSIGGIVMEEPLLTRKIEGENSIFSQLLSPLVQI